MSQKKTAVNNSMPKQQNKNKFAVYIERYREIEIYLTLLTKPLLPSIIPATTVGHSELFDKVEAEIKEFIEQKLQILTGLNQPETESGLSKEELSALKIVASTVLKKTPPKPEPEPVVEQTTTYARVDGKVVQVDSVPTVFDKEEVEPEVQKEDPVTLETEEVSVTQVQESAVKKAKKGKAPKAILPTEIPPVEKGQATDTMKKVRPVGVKPLPPPPIEQSASLAVAQAEAMQQELLAAQMKQAATLLPDNLGMPNLINPLFR